MKADINGINLHYEVHGHGQPVLFIHGFPLSGELWAPAVERLGDGCTLVVPDLRGLGQSEATDDCSMGDYADDLNCLLDAIGETSPAIVVGLSMGGYIAFEFHRRYPERLRALVLADTRAVADTQEAAKARIVLAQRVLREGSSVVADAMLEKLFAPDASLKLRETWRRIMAASNPKGVAAALQAMGRRPDSIETLGTIEVPTLIIVGEKDALTPPADARTMQEGIAGSRLETIPGAGHMTPMEAPDRFAEVLREFVASLA